MFSYQTKCRLTLETVTGSSRDERNSPMQAQSTPTAIIPTTHNLQAAQPASMNPARVYLASLAPGSVRTMRQALATVAAIASGVDVPTGIDDQVALIDATPWGALRFQHTTAITRGAGDSL
jgi:hypothetical protein